MSGPSGADGSFADAREHTSELLLHDLDEGQREAATTLRGPVCILAGAGSGKTRTITRRIAHGINTGAYSPERILALTFTARAAGEMKTRLRHLNAGTVEAATFHAAALRQLTHFWPTVVGGDAPRVLGGKAQLLTEAARNLSIRVDSATLRDLAGDIEWRKVSNLSLEAYEALTTRPSLGKLTRPQVLELHTEYERLKEDRRIIDFEDVLLLTAGLLANEEGALMQVRERYRFFVVDEYQDVSPLQHDLLRLWLGDRRDLCVVGDANQTIYSFTGATNRYLLEFATEFPEAAVIRLDTNYRSAQPIVQIANDVMRENPGALTLSAHVQTGAKPERNEYPDDGAEARGVAAKIAREIATGTPARDIAVLYRVNSQSAVLEQALSDAGVSAILRHARSKASHHGSSWGSSLHHQRTAFQICERRRAIAGLDPRSSSCNRRRAREVGSVQCARCTGRLGFGWDLLAGVHERTAEATRGAPRTNARCRDPVVHPWGKRSRVAQCVSHWPRRGSASRVVRDER